MRYFTVDAFAQVPFGGNPAGVVLLEKNCNFPDDQTMRKIAAEMRYSETAFSKVQGSFRKEGWRTCQLFDADWL